MLGAQGANPETPGQAPFYFTIKCPGFFYVHYTTHGTYSFTSHLKDEAIMIKCLSQKHKRRDRPDQNSNPHSDNTRTWVQCTRPLGHDTPVWNPLLSMRIPNRSQLGNSLTVFLLKKHHSTMYTIALRTRTVIACPVGLTHTLTRILIPSTSIVACQFTFWKNIAFICDNNMLTGLMSTILSWLWDTFILIESLTIPNRSQLVNSLMVFYCKIPPLCIHCYTYQNSHCLSSWAHTYTDTYCHSEYLHCCMSAHILQI